MNPAGEPVAEENAPDQDPIPLMTVSKDVVLPLGLLQAVVLAVAVAVACFVLLRRQRPDDATPGDR